MLDTVLVATLWVMLYAEIQPFRNECNNDVFENFNREDN